MLSYWNILMKYRSEIYADHNKSKNNINGKSACTALLPNITVVNLQVQISSLRKPIRLSH
uniref:Uncharacterized protein n=1 Tax=Rhizophagus irregularis (strain DAOM 181602 / DAOM 197198 / MUCL 43194) TaxID=747089 RepID=U9SJT0_RHIID